MLLLISLSLMAFFAACGNASTTATPTAEPTALPTTAPTLELSPTAEVVTEAATHTPAPTAAPQPSNTPAPSDSCVSADQITIADVGQTLCVSGIVRKINHTEQAVFVLFEGSAVFYWLAYDMTNIPRAKVGMCLQTTHPVEVLYDQPVMVLHWTDSVYECGGSEDLLHLK
jgi:hypothetical protein